MKNNKYIPPHLRIKKNKKQTNDFNSKPDLSKTTSIFPELTKEIIANAEYNPEWRQHESKENKNVNKTNEPIYVTINNLSFIYDETIERGWIVLNKDKTKNRCNITQLEADDFNLNRGCYDNNEDTEFIYNMKPFKNIIPKKVYNRLYNCYEYNNEDDISFTTDSINDNEEYDNDNFYDNYDDTFENTSDCDDYYSDE